MKSYLGQRKPPRLSLQGKPGILQEADYLQHYSNHRHYNPPGFDKTTTRPITEPFSQITSKKLRFLSRPPGAKDHGELNCGIAVPLPRWKTASPIPLIRRCKDLGPAAGVYERWRNGQCKKLQRRRPAISLVTSLKVTCRSAPMVTADARFFVMEFSSRCQ